LAEAERFVCRQINDCAEAGIHVRFVLDSELTPVVLDIHRTDSSAKLYVVLGFAGTRHEVDWQLGQARKLGFENETSLDYETQFWSDATPVNHLSVLPSRITDVIRDLGPRPFVARAGNGVIYFRGGAIPMKKNLPIDLMRRLKSTYDPKNILPELTV
jgi:FAD/FMN-containing dehydrogenase